MPFVAAAVGMLWLDPITAPVAFVAAPTPGSSPSCTRPAAPPSPGPRGPRHERAEPVAQGLLGDLLDPRERELQRATGLALERGELGVWLVGEAGALLLTPGGRRVHGFCVAVPEAELPPSDRVAHLLLALRVDEEGFATVANHTFAGAPWRVRRRLPAPCAPRSTRASVQRDPFWRRRASLDGCAIRRRDRRRGLRRVVRGAAAGAPPAP